MKAFSGQAARAETGVTEPDSAFGGARSFSAARRKVLVVDDSALVLKLTGAMLQAAGFEVSTCDNAAGVLLRVITEKPDLVLVDLDLGGVSGERVVASLKNSPRTAHVRAYLYTAAEAAEVNDAWRRSRADGVIAKGSDLAGFTAAVRRALPG